MAGREAVAPDLYSFLTGWQFDAPIERVWRVITDVERYPEWWPGVWERDAPGFHQPVPPPGRGTVHRQLPLGSVDRHRVRC